VTSDSVFRDKRTFLFVLAWFVVGLMINLTGGTHYEQNRMLWNGVALLLGAAVLLTQDGKLRASVPLVGAGFFAISASILLMVGLILTEEIPGLCVSVAVIVDNLGYYPAGPDADLVISLIIWGTSLLLLGAGSFVVARVLLPLVARLR